MKKLSTMGVAFSPLYWQAVVEAARNALQTSALEGEWNIITVNGKEATADKDVFYRAEPEREQSIRLCRM